MRRVFKHFGISKICLLAASGPLLAQPTRRTITGDVTIGPGGIGAFTWAINNATSEGGPTPDANGEVSGWTVIFALSRTTAPTANGNFNWTATPSTQFDFALMTLIDPTPVGGPVVQGPMANFNPYQSYAFPFVLFPGTYTGPTSDSVLNADTVFDYTNFVNAHPGTFGWSLNVYSPAGTGGELDLVYTPAPVPEPGTLALAAFGCVIVARRALRTRLPRAQIA